MGQAVPLSYFSDETNSPQAAAWLRFTGVRLAESLQDALRVAESRGYRLAPALTPAEAEETRACAAGPGAGIGGA
ncbi:hypothetical protein OG242_07435 [Streptomyces sp. NBC_00727]|uniref:hypothetical protein n=1 Tax=Streptomyces sp. NBC_00727 TaxID=2903675 RepID=UPI00386F648C